MPTYVTFFSYTQEAAQRMVARPEDRAEAARALIEGVGGRLQAFHWMFGDYDGLVIYEVPEPRIAAAAAIAVATSGGLKALKTHQLLDPGEARIALEHARIVAQSYEPPGGRGPWHEDYDSLG